MTATNGLRRTGDGSPLLLLHGFTCTWRIWQPVIAPLAEHHDVIVPTLPGHSGGPSMTAGTEVSVAGIADGVERILDAAGIETAHLCGNSLGGWLTLELARRGRARSVVALAPAGGWDVGDDVRATADQIRKSARLARLAAPFMGPSLALPQVRRRLLSAIMERGDRVPSGEAHQMLVDAGACSIVDEFASATVRDGPFTGDLTDVTVPIRIAWCQNDRLLEAAAHGRPLLERVPAHAEFVVLPGVGHTPMYDDPLLVVSTILDVTLAADAPTPGRLVA